MSTTVQTQRRAISPGRTALRALRALPPYVTDGLGATASGNPTAPPRTARTSRRRLRLRRHHPTSQPSRRTAKPSASTPQRASRHPRRKPTRLGVANAASRSPTSADRPAGPTTASPLGPCSSPTRSSRSATSAGHSRPAAAATVVWRRQSTTTGSPAQTIVEQLVARPSKRRAHLRPGRSQWPTPTPRTKLLKTAG